MESRNLLSISSVQLSIVVPLFNEEKIIKDSCLRLQRILGDIVESFEILAIDDGSTDETLKVLNSLLSEIKELRVIRLHSNRGHMMAISVGLQHAKGDVIAIIDADLQDPPEALSDMYEII